MSHAEQSQNLVRRNLDEDESANSGTFHRESSRLQSLHVKEGGFEISLADGALPEFLVEANAAIRAGHIEQTISLLDEHNIAVARRLTEQDPTRTDVMFVLAKLFVDTEQYTRAEEWYGKILDREANGIVFDAMADICVKDPHRYTEAVFYCKRAVEAAPGNLDFLFNLGRSLIKVGQVRDGIELLREVADRAPGNFVANSALLWYLQYLPDLNKRTFFERYKRLMRIGAPMSMARQSHDNDPDPQRRLRVGYISPDFRRHSVALVFEPFLDSHNRREVDVYGYGYVAAPDKITECFQQKFDHYRGIRRNDPEKIAHLIEQDKVDILVALGGHSQDNCLAVLAYKPAPIQVDYGGINTTGMEQVDYRFTDSLIDPPHLRQFYVEESVCLPGGVHWYRPPHDSPLVGPLPAQRNGYVTFASFNNHIKITAYIMSLWVEILKANPGSRLILKFLGGHDEHIRSRYLDQFEQLGIGRERVDVYGTAPSHFEHLELFNEVDIALDPYPFNGCITTMEGLWMGVPVVSLVGENLVSRVGLSILNRVGLDVFAASTGAEYVAKARAFAAQLEDLARIRASLRQRMLTSDLCDSTRIVREVETAYRRMWHRWCRSKGADVPGEEGGLSREVSIPKPNNSGVAHLNSVAK